MRSKIRYIVNNYTKHLSGVIIREDENFVVIESDLHHDKFTIAKSAIIERLDKNGGEDG